MKKDKQEKYPIIAHGEKYIDSIPIISRPNNKEMPHEYDEAKTSVISNLEKIEDYITNSNEIFMDDKVLCVRLEPKFEAKSYLPSSIAVSEDMKFIGGRKYSNIAEDGAIQKSKLYFIRTKDIGISKLKEILKSGEKDSIESWRRQIQSINKIDLLSENEKVQGFVEKWTKGNVELVLHPMGKKNEEKVLKAFCSLVGISRKQINVRSYNDGIMFISMICDVNMINKIKKFNPLRSIHPMGDIEEDPFRMRLPAVEGPQPAKVKMKSKVVVGVFDGGTNESIPLLNGYVKANDEVNTQATASSIRHGTGVCGAILYGHIGGKIPSDEMENPSVSIESFRVLPEDKSSYGGKAEEMLGMYATIDTIERIVKERKDIKLFNLSIGPKMPIIDDEISRFTYVLDMLTHNVEENEINPLFCIAVGNDGDKGKYLDRIQVPSDMVNGLAIGAYSFNSLDEKIHAEYSSMGPGREGAKIKPDIVEFGGSLERPFVAVGPNGNTLEAVSGTSFATPLATGKIGKMMAECEEIVPHMGRTLLIHNAHLEDGVRNHELGYGFSEDDVADILNCEQNKVTILYQGELEAASTAKLPIFAPMINQSNGNVTITWTITTIVNPDTTDTDAYTNNCIEDTFYPNSTIYNFTKKGSKTYRLNITNPDDSKLIEKLLQSGYKMPTLPASAPAKKGKSENELRNKDLKWDTVIKKKKTMRATSLLNPFLTVHAMGRNGFEHQKIKYFIAITIEAPKYKGNLYDNILQTYTSLTPLEVRNVNKVMVSIK